MNERVASPLAAEAGSVATRALWRRWVLVVGLGELAGFTAPGVMGALTQGQSAGSRMLLLVLGGILEGAALGFSQALVLRRVLPGFKTRAWVGATGAAAGVAWLLGMLPSTTHSVWSTWSPWWIVLAGVVSGLVLLGSIGTAQALVMPPGTSRPYAWIGWTALGWCTGLAAFSAVAPPLWHPGQSPWQLVMAGVAGGAVMAFVMAGVTGLGVVRFRRAAVARGNHVDHIVGPRSLSSLLGTEVFTDRGELAGRVLDLVVDLGRDLDRLPVTGVVLAHRGEPDRVLAWGSLAERPEAPGLALARHDTAEEWASTSSQVLARRDILDSPVVLVSPSRRARVSDVVLELGPEHAWVTGLDVSSASALRRLLGQAPLSSASDPVRLSQVHLLSRGAHSAQLTVPEALVYRLAPPEMAEVLTRVSVTHARDILRVADRRVTQKALAMLHPLVRDRVTGAVGVPRRTRRLAGWMLRRPAHGSGNGSGNGSDSAK